MVLNINRAIADGHLLYLLTGLDPQEFTGLLPDFKAAYVKAGFGLPQPRSTAAGEIDPENLPPEHQLFFVLLHTHHNLTRDFTSQLFNLSRFDANFWTQRLKIVLESALGKPLPLPKAQSPLENMADLHQRFPEIKQAMTIVPQPDRPEFLDLETDVTGEQPAPLTTYTLNELAQKPAPAQTKFFSKRIGMWVLGLVILGTGAGIATAIALSENRWAFLPTLRSTSSAPSGPDSAPVASSQADSKPILKPSLENSANTIEEIPSPQGRTDALLSESLQADRSTAGTDYGLNQASDTAKLPYFNHLPYATLEDASQRQSIGFFTRDTYQREEFLHFEAASAFTQMQATAAAEGIDLMPISGFRSEANQAELFEKQTERHGSKAAAAELSAPAGYSEHHTGYAVDIGDAQVPDADLKYSFETTPAYSWLLSNAANFGFEQSFPPNNIQGVSFEPWHWRYIKSANAARIFAPAEATGAR